MELISTKVARIETALNSIAHFQLDGECEHLQQQEDCAEGHEAEPHEMPMDKAYDDLSAAVKLARVTIER